jgi:glycosyltransferase involved in cell wall biosynthesis
MKRILVLNYEFPPLGGGASPVSYEIAERLSRTGDFDIDVVTMSYKGLPKYEEVNKNFRIHRVKCLRGKKELCHPWEQLTYLFFGYFKCCELLKKNKFDICHCHFIIPTGVLAQKLKKKFGLEYVITAHGSDVLGYNPRFKKLYPFLIKTWKNILDDAKKITSPSNFLKGEIIKAYRHSREGGNPVSEINPDKIEVIPNGIEEGKFEPMEKEKYILLVSRLFINKGIQDFLEAIKDIDSGEWKVKIVGEGPFRSELEKKVVEYNLQDKVEFLGWVDNKSRQMKELYGKASVFVLPSHFENMNMTLLEAMQAGCNIIATDVGGNSEIVNDQNSLVISGNKDDFKKKIAIALKKVGGTVYSPKNNFSWNKILPKYIETL